MYRREKTPYQLAVLQRRREERYARLIAKLAEHEKETVKLNLSKEGLSNAEIKARHQENGALRAEINEVAARAGLPKVQEFRFQKFNEYFPYTPRGELKDLRGIT